MGEESRHNTMTERTEFPLGPFVNQLADAMEQQVEEDRDRPGPSPPPRLVPHRPNGPRQSGREAQPTQEEQSVITTLADPRESFPLARDITRTADGGEPPTGATTRPWILRFARVPDATQAVVKPSAFYDDELQMSVGLYDGPLPYMQTHSPTIPDGSTSNPPPLDEGPKD